MKQLAAHFEAQGGSIGIATITEVTMVKKRPELHTDKGVFSADKIVLTTGIGSKPMLEKLGLRVPMESEIGYHIELLNPSSYPVSPMMVAAGKFVITPMKGRIRCAGLVEIGGDSGRAINGAA